MTDVKWWGGVGAEYYCNAVMYTPTLIYSEEAIKAGEDKRSSQSARYTTIFGDGFGSLQLLVARVEGPHACLLFFYAKATLLVPRREAGRSMYRRNVREKIGMGSMRQTRYLRHEISGQITATAARYYSGCLHCRTEWLPATAARYYSVREIVV